MGSLSMTPLDPAAPRLASPPPPAEKAPELFVYGLGSIGADCNVDKKLERIGVCRPVSARAGTAGPAKAAFDGDTCTKWSADSESAEVDLGGTRDLSGVLLVAEQSPKAGAVHVLELVGRDGKTIARFEVSTPLFSAHAFAGVFVTEKTIAASKIRIHTSRAAGPVVWREILPYACRGPVHSPKHDFHEAEAIEGRGYCETAADCVGDSCCHARTCVSRALAPKCDGVRCTRNCAGGTMDCARGHCTCVNNRCGSVVETPVSGPILGPVR